MKELEFDSEKIEEFENESDETPVKSILKLLDEKERTTLNLHSEHLPIDAKAKLLTKRG